MSVEAIRSRSDEGLGRSDLVRLWSGAERVVFNRLAAQINRKYCWLVDNPVSGHGLHDALHEVRAVVVAQTSRHPYEPEAERKETS